MAYRGVDRKRFTYLLSLGTDEFELKQFFVDSRLQLIQRGGRVQNLPHGTNARIRTLAVELPPSTDEVVQSWFAKNLTMVDPEEAEVIIGVFKRYEELKEELPEEKARRLARSCLVHLFSKDPPDTLLEFLGTPIGGPTIESEEAADLAASDGEVPHGVPYPETLPQVLVDLVEGKDADEHLEHFPPDLGTFVSALQLVQRGQTGQARETIQTLSADSDLRALVEQAIRAHDAKNASSETSQRGLRIIDAELFEGGFDYEQDEVLAYCTKADKATAVFVRPLAVVRSGRMQLLTEDSRRELFPDTGDVMAFSGPSHPRQPRRGEMGIWRVAEHQTEKATHFHISSDKRPVYEVRAVPFPSTEYDSVREYLKHHAERSHGSFLQPLLFQLSDGLIVGSRSERPDLSKDESFESGLLLWHSLPAMRFEGRLYVAGPLPKEQGIYECASLAVTVRKLFKKREKTTGELTKAQLSFLAQSLDSREAELNALRLQRIKAEIERLGDQQEAFDALVDELMNRPDIEQRIDDLVKKEAARQLDERDRLRDEIARLQKERGEWQARARKQREEYRKLPEGVSKAVKNAFLRARNDGLSTLADLAVFQALAESSATSPASARTSAAHYRSLASPIVRELESTDAQPVSVLKSLGVPFQRAAGLALCGEAARRAGLVLCVRGVAARRAVESWAKAIAKQGVLVDATVGMVDDSILTDVLLRSPTPDVVAVLDANLSALDIFARPLSDLILGRLVEKSEDQPLGVLLSLTDGVGALPLPTSFARLSLTIDLDANYLFRDASEASDLMAEFVSPEDGALYAMLWKPAAESLRKQLERLTPEQRVMVLSILTTHKS